MNRTLEHLHHATRIVMERHRQVRWQPMTRPEQAAFIPEWLRHSRTVPGGLSRDFTGTTAL